MGSVLSSIGGAAKAALPFLGPVGGAVGAVSGLLGGGGGGGGGGGENMRQSGGSAFAPETQERQAHLWNQAQRYAATNPFSQQYGGASSMPGMGAMSQAGQEYMTDAILGPGAYQAQPNLGFADYQRPGSANSTGRRFQYETDYDFDSASGQIPTGSRQRHRDLYGPRPSYNPDSTVVGGEAKGSAPAGLSTFIPGGLGGPGGEDPMIAARRGMQPTQLDVEWKRRGMAAPSADLRSAVSGGGSYIPVDALQQGTPLQQRERQSQQLQQLQQMPHISSGNQPERGGLLGAGDVGTSPTVGIGEMEMGSLATRRMLEEAGPETPGVTDITAPTIGRTTVGDVTDIGDIGQATAPGRYEVGDVDPTAIGQTTVTGPTDITAGTVNAPTSFDIGDVTGQTTESVAGVDPTEFGGASFLGGPSIQDYMNTAGVNAQMADAQEDYGRQLNELQAQQAGSGSFGSRTQLQDLGALDRLQRNKAAIQGAGFDRAAGLMEADIGRQQEAGLQSQRLGVDTGRSDQALEAQRRESDANRAQQAMLANQQVGLEVGKLEQNLGTQVGIQNAQNALSASQANLNAAMQSGDRQAQIDAQRQMRDAELNVETAMNTQNLDARSGMQDQQLNTQVVMQNAQNEIAIAEQNMQSALQTGSQQAQIDAQRQMAKAQMGLDAATRNQATSLQADSMGLDAQAQFRQQQIQNARQLADIGGMTQGATFGAGQQLQAMGAQQEAAQRRQQAFDYEQWLRGQQGGAQELALAQSFMPGGMQQQFERNPSKWGQIGGGLLGAAGLGLGLYDRFGNQGDETGGQG